MAAPFNRLLPASHGAPTLSQTDGSWPMTEISLFLSFGIVHEFLIPPTSEAKRPNYLVLPNMGASYSFNSSSRVQLTTSHFLAFQLIWILAALQWGLSRTGQVLDGGTWDYFGDMETRLQITVIFFYLRGTRRCPAFLSGGAKQAVLPGVKGRLFRVASLLLIHDLHACILNLHIIDFALISILLARFCAPQSTSLFTSPCRPFTSPFPQCQDLLHAPPTYVMTFWLVFFILHAVGVALDWFENGVRVSGHFTKWRSSSSSRFTPSLFPFLPRCCLFLFCLNLAFDPDPGPPYWAIKPALFSPAAPLEGWIFSISIAVFLALGANALQWGIRKLGAFSFLRIFSLLNSHPNLSNYKISLSSLRWAYRTPRLRSQARDRPEKFSKTKAYKCKRSPLTPHTFEPPFSRRATSNLLSFPFDAQEPVDATYKEAKLSDLASTATALVEMVDVGNVDGASLNVAGSAYSARESLLEPRSITPPTKRGTYFDKDKEGRLPHMRPTSRLGFNAEEVPSRRNSCRGFDGDSEMEGTAAMFLRPSLQQGEFPQPLTYRASSSAWSHQLDRSLTPSHDATPPSPWRTLFYHSSGSSSPSAPDDDDSEDWDPFALSQARLSYDWARAATLFSGSVDIGYEVEEAEKRRAFRLAQVPDLHTIEEEETSDELEMHCVL